MMYVNEEYSQYKYVVGISDNYLILAKQPNVVADWNNPKTIDVVYQYLNPSFLTVEATRTFTSTTVFSEVETSQSFFARADSLDLIKVQMIVIFFVIFVLNALTRFVRKGGVFFGS